MTNDVITPDVISSIDCGDCGPYAIVFGPTGDMWVTLIATGEILRRRPDGAERRFTIGKQPGLLVADRKATWCAVTGADRIARVGLDNQVSFVDAPGGPYGLAVAGDVVWTTLMQANRIASVGKDRLDVEVQLPIDKAVPAMIAAHEDGSVWASLSQGRALARRDPTGRIDVIDLPEGAVPVGIAIAGSDVWAADIGKGRILRVDPSLRIHEYRLDIESRPHAVVANTGGCWFTEWGTNRLGRIDGSGCVTEFDLADFGDEPHGLAADSNGTVWVAFESGAVVGVAVPRPAR